MSQNLPPYRNSAASDAGPQRPDGASIDAFVSDVLDVAASVAPSLAGILGAPSPDREVKPWTGGRRRGLELCLSMLRYARVEIAQGDDARRLDLGIRHLEAELAVLDEAG